MNLAIQDLQSTLQTKLVNLRSLLSSHQLDGYLIPSADEHLNEYLPKVKQRRQWLSGFTGSAGDLLVGQQQAWVFVDSRYYEQADLEVDASLIQICKVGLEGHKTVEETLQELGREAKKQGNEFRLGLDPFTISVSQFREFEKQLEPCGVKLILVADNFVDRIRNQQPWQDAEPLPAYADSPLFHLSEAVTGETIARKLERVREAMQQKGADVLPVTKLDQIAWLYNLRGWDVPYNPVFIAYAIVTLDQAFLFTNLNRIEPELQQVLADAVTLLPYEKYAETLKSLLKPTSQVLLDPKHSTMGTSQLITSAQIARMIKAANPIEGMKARKNTIEIEQMQQANLKASRAKTRALKWIADQLHNGQVLTEVDVATTVERFYAEESGFQGLSFNTIAATGANSSIVHYGTPNPERVLQASDLLLLDSGAQYASGTTDDTRTVTVGNPTAEQIACYTEVLKAHINCAMQRFPKGTTGAQLDGITRSTLWDAGLDYGHGTGHGVGAFLNVHEGPNGISKKVQEPLEPGMVTSVEPGYYKSGWGGIRIENLYVVRQVPAESTTNPEAPPWYCLESLTYIPFDKRLIDLSKLNDRQRAWLEQYHQAVVDRLMPSLSPEAGQWLKAACDLTNPTV